MVDSTLAPTADLLAEDLLAEDLLKTAASKLAGSAGQMFLSEVCDRLCCGNSRQAEYRFGWGRETLDEN